MKLLCDVQIILTNMNEQLHRWTFEFHKDNRFKER